jgi:hypothetical protein
MSGALIPRKAVDTLNELLQQQLRALDATLTTLELIRKEMHDLTEGCMLQGDIEPGVAAGFDMISDVMVLLSTRFAPESEVQLRDLVLRILDNIDAEPEEIIQ